MMTRMATKGILITALLLVCPMLLGVFSFAPNTNLGTLQNRFTTPQARRSLFMAQDTIKNEKAIATDGAAIDEECVVEEELSETQQLMKKVKDAGLAGVISYALWELGFWAVSVPVCFVGYREVTGHWPDLANKEDVAQLGAEAFAFVNFARFAVPLRIGLALGTTGWIQENVVDRFKKDDVPEECKEE